MRKTKIQNNRRGVILHYVKILVKGMLVDNGKYGDKHKTTGCEPVVLLLVYLIY
jgi:hypothetical protein